MTQKERPRRWSVAILRLLQEAAADGVFDPKTCRMLVVGIDVSWTRIQCWWLNVWDYESSRSHWSSKWQGFQPLFSFGIPDLLEAVDILDGREESEIPDTAAACWATQRDESRPRFSAALGALLTEAREDLLEACRLLASDPVILGFPGMVAFFEYGRTQSSPQAALRLICFAGFPDAAPLLPFLEHRAPKPGKKPLRLRGLAARTPEGIRLFYAEGDLPELNRGAQRPTTLHYRWEDLEGFGVDYSPEYAHGKVYFREKGSPVPLVFFPRRPANPQGGGPGEMIQLFSGGRLFLKGQPGWPVERGTDRSMRDLRAPREIPDDDSEALEGALATWIQRKYDLHLHLYPDFKTGGVGLFRSEKTLVVTVTAPESFAACSVSWRGHTGERFSSQRAVGSSTQLDEEYVDRVLGLEVSADDEPEFQGGTPLGERLRMILPDPEFRRQLFRDLFTRIEGMEAFRKSAAGRVYLGTGPGGVLWTLRDPAKPWIPYRPPFADRNPYQDSLFQGQYHSIYDEREIAKRSLVHLKMVTEYAEQGVPSAVSRLLGRFGVERPSTGDRALLRRVRRELLAAHPELQVGLLQRAYRELSRCDDPEFERFLLDFAMGDAPSEIRDRALSTVRSSVSARGQSLLNDRRISQSLERCFGSLKRAIAFAMPIIPRMKGPGHALKWDERWILGWIKGRIPGLPAELLTLPGDTHRLIQAIQERARAATEEESEWASEMLSLVIEVLRDASSPPEWKAEAMPVLEFLSQERGYRFYRLHDVAREALRPGGLLPRNY